ncbi:MAG: hypothetical protein IPP29_21990 [Bacteroidetes bacterium]|nr:hypothetical protein [Bacteroidota bacterium]
MMFFFGEKFAKDIGYQTNYRNKADDEARKEADGSGGTMKRAATIYNLKKPMPIKHTAELEELTTTTSNHTLIQLKLLFDKSKQ